MTSKPEMLFQRYSIDYIFKDYCGRRTALVLALTEDFEELFKQCNQGMDYNLCLYGYPNGTWEVTRPEKEVPPSLPVPVLGINFSKEKKKPRAWRCQVAVHSDSWLLSVAFSLGNHLYRKERTLLFNRINNHPTVFEAVTNWKLSMENHIVDNGSGRKHPKIPKFNPIMDSGSGSESREISKFNPTVDSGRGSGSKSRQITKMNLTEE